MTQPPDPSRTTALGQRLDAHLRRLLDRVRRRFLVHGAGWMAAAVAIGVVIYFALDRLLDLPVAVRLILTVALVTFLAFGFRRRIAYPLGRRISGDDVAVAVERRFPELEERLISAVQLAGADRALRGQSEAMVAQVVEQAAEDVARLPTSRILDPKRTVRIWSLAAIALLVTGVVLLREPQVTRVFFARMVGSAASYPRETTLFVELPIDDPTLEVELSDGAAHVILASGGDLPVLVRAEGVVPRDVSLVLETGRGAGGEIGMTSRGAARFRHVFRRIHHPFSFRARGGDDPRGDRIVTVETIEPPRVSTIRAEVTYPNYTGRPPEELVGGGIEAVVGSSVRLFVRATEDVREARLRFVDSGQILELAPIELRDDSGAGVEYAGNFDLSRSDRYQIEFVGKTGIGNPRPGTYPIVAQEDYAPVAKLVSPAADDLLVTLPDALLPVRIFASDDFGVASIEARTLVGDEAHETVVGLHRGPSTPSGPPSREVLAHRLLEVRELGPDDQPVAVGETVLILGEVTDNRQPHPQVTAVTERHVHVVSATDLTRRISGHFRRIRESVEKALDLQRSRHEQLAALRSAEGGIDPATNRDRLIAIEVGQGRVLAESRRVHRELMRSFDVHLFNRLDESLHAARVVEMYDAYHQERTSSDPEDPGFYRRVVAARQNGEIGAMEKALDPILAMLQLADRLAYELGPEAVQVVESASVADSRARFAEALDATKQLQERLLADLEELRGKLDEWNEFQDVIQQARSLRDRQKDLRTRTRSLQGSTK